MKVLTEIGVAVAEPSDATGPKAGPRVYKPKGGRREGAGRPRTAPPVDAVLGEVGESKKLYLPQLPGGWRASFPVFVKWWKSLTKEQLEYLAIYVYRKWPTWEPKRFDRDATSNIHIYANTICPFSEEAWEREILNEFGSGDYTFSINDNSVNRWTIWAKGLRDFENYPPLMDLRLVMWEDMANKPFFQFLKLRGRLPEGMGDDSDKGDSMAANAALERMAETTDRLTDKVIDLATEASRRPEGNQDQVQGMKLMHEAGRESISFMRETMSEITKNQNSNPLEVVEKVVSLVGVMNGGNSKTDVILEMMKSEREIAARREESIREELRDARKRSDDLMMLLIKKENADEEPKGLMGRLMEKVMSDAIDGIGKKTDDAAEPSGGKSNMRDTIMTMLIPVLPSIMGTVDNIVKNVMTGIMVGKAGTVTPGASPMAPVAQPTLTTAPPPPAAPANPLTPFLTAITGSFLHHFNQGPEFGCVFADWLKNSGPIDTWPQPGMTGQGVYDFMTEQEAHTPGSIKAVLQTHPPIWSNVEGVPAKLDAFIAEFLKNDEGEPGAE